MRTTPVSERQGPQPSAGAVKCLPKPFTDKDLVDTFSHALARTAALGSTA
jgi:hypothetical protein